MAKPVIVIPRQVQRREDMSPDGHLRLYLQEDGDIVLTVHGRRWGSDEPSTASIEFCADGGGGRSPRTVEALKLLMAAMQADEDAGHLSRDYERQYHFDLRPEDRDYSR